jgi:hypothetical protein
MEEGEAKATSTTLSTVLWYAIFIWFASSLFSQSFYMALNGEPYDAITMLKELGPVYYIVVVVELAVWISLSSLLVRKVVQKTRTASKIQTLPA